MFVVYDIIYRLKAALGYSLLIKSGVWDKTEELIKKLTHAQLIAAATKIKETNQGTDPAILALERYVQTVAAYVPHSYAQYFQFWLWLKALMITNGMLVFWITINLADLQFFLVIPLAGVNLDLRNNTQSAFAHKTGIINLVVVATFSHIICDAEFMSLLASGKLEAELLGPISNYFATVKTNGRGILHLHCLFWLKGVSHLPTLRSQIQDNKEFRQKLFLFLEHVIKCSASQDPQPETLHHACPNANNSMTTSQFADLLRSDSEAVPRKVQMHSPLHNPTCYKYTTRDSKVCRFDFLRPILLRLQIDSNGTVQLRRDNRWVNPWNPAIASLI